MRSRDSDPTLHPNSPSPDEATIDLTSLSAAAPLREGPGSRIGPYRILQLIGEGGFGTVFMAEQEQPVQRRVAIKIIKLGMDTRQVVARFEQERQALAIMDHSNIARVLDAGATDTGRPYFVMELVKGDPVVDYCDKNNLSIQERLQLFEQICAAVQHAHTKGIIHRDIKPSNILVSMQDGRPSAKVIDFGIAKATGAQLTEKTLFTEHRQLIGTPEYMSPEQAEGSLDIDTRTDVYSLGVLLYELLTGTTPFSGRDLRSVAYAEIQRIIREVEPPRPSTRISQAAETLASVAAKRHTEPRKLGVLLRGELDWIVMKAMEKDRHRRYETANGLGMDVRRYLSGEVVLAAPPSRVYRVRTFMRRNKGAVTAGAIIAASMLVGASISVAGFVHASRQRDLAIAAESRAKSESERATAAEATAVAEARSATTIADFMSSMLRGVGPQVALGRDTTLLREILEKTEERVGTELAGQPLVASRMFGIIASVYNQLALKDKADTNARRALTLVMQAPGDNRLHVARATYDIAVVLEANGKYDDAKAKYQEAYDLFLAADAGDSEHGLSALMGVGGVLFRTRDYAGAEAIFRKGIEGRRAIANGADSANIASSLDRLSIVLTQNANTHAEGEALAREALAMRRRLFGELHPDIALSLSNLAANLSRQGRYDEAMELDKQALEQHRKIYGERHPRTASAISSYASTLLNAKRHAEAVEMLRLCVDINIESLGADHRSTLDSRFTLGVALDATKDFAGAEGQYRAMLAWARANYKPADNRTSAVIMLVANAVAKQGRHSDAEILFREALDGVVANRPVGHASIVQARNGLADCLVAQGRCAEAEPLLLAVEEQARIQAGAVERIAAINRLAEFYAAWDQAEPGAGHATMMAEWKARLDTANQNTANQNTSASGAAK